MSVLGGALRGHALRLARLLEELDGPARRAVRAGHPDPTAPERELYLAISDRVYERLFTRQSFRVVVEQLRIALLVVNLQTEEVVQWIN